MIRTVILFAALALLVTAVCAPPAVGDVLTVDVVEDTYIQQLSPTENFATTAWLRAGYDYSNYIQRALFQFDELPDLGAGIVVDSAVLRLYLNWQETGGVQGNTRIWRLTSGWTETGATWRIRDGINEWDTYGGDFDPTAIYVGPPSRNAAVDHYYFDVTQTVKDWYEGTYPNHGLAVDNVGNWVYWASKEFDINGGHGGTKWASLEITTKPSPSTVNVNVVLEDYDFDTGDSSLMLQRIEILDGESVVKSVTKQASQNTSLTYNDIDPGTYTVRASAPKWLSKAEILVTEQGGVYTVNLSLPNGDITGDNLIGTVDFSILSGNFDQAGD